MNNPFKVVPVVLALLILNSLFLIPDVFAEMSSENFVIDGGHVNSGGIESASSSNFLMVNTLGEAGIGTVSSTNFEVGGGFQYTIITVTTTPSTPTPTPEIIVPPGGGRGGGTISAALSPQVVSVDSPLAISPSQSGLLTQHLSDGKTVVLDVPRDAALSEIIFTIREELLTVVQAPAFTLGARLVGDNVFDITARDTDGNVVTTFSKPLTITVKIPEALRGLPDLGLYFLDSSVNAWVLIPDAVFTDQEVTFQVDHLTLFGIWSVSNVPQLLPITACQGADFNVDGVVGLVDFGILIFFWETFNPSNPCVDVDNSGIVDLVDFGVLVFEWSGAISL